MDISLKHNEYKILKPTKESVIEECVEGELLLPEYMPDILRIIKAVAEPKLVSCKLVGERVTVDGACEMRMIYTAEDNCIYSFCVTKQFTRYCENTEYLNAADVNASLKVSFVNCRAVGNKKAEIKAGVKININGFCCETEDIIFADEPDIQQKIEKLDVFSLGCKKSHAFSMSDTITLSEPCSSILTQRANAVLTEVKKINNKLMLRGDVVLELTYVNAENKSLTERIAHSLPVNQIVEIEGLEEHFDGTVIINVSSLDLIPKGSENGFITNYDIALGLVADVSMWEGETVTVLTDAYSVNSTSNLVRKPFLYYSPLCKLNENFILNESFTTNADGVQNILDCFGEIDKINIMCLGNELVFSGTLSTVFIIRDSGDTVSCISKAFDFKFNKQSECQDEKIFCNTDVKLLSIKASLKRADTIEINAELCICGYVLKEICLDTVTDITVSEEKLIRDKPSLIVYFPEKEGESLWDIARKYNTSVAAIATENDIKGEFTENLRVLFIPCA